MPSYSLDAAYCPACGHRLRRHTHRPCAGCGYETGDVESWRTLREMMTQGEEDAEPASWNDVNLPLFAWIVAEAVRREETDGE